MELTITHRDLSQALDLISRIPTKHITLPILQCVLLRVSEIGITLSATNLEVNVTVPLKGNSIEYGVIAIPAHVLVQSIQFVSDGSTMLTLRTEDQVLIIETPRSNTSIKLFEPDDFPSQHMVTDDGVSLQGVLFAQGIKTVAFAASQTSIKPELGSIYIYQKREHTLTFVATDSFRLMEVTLPQKGLVLPQGILVPQKNALELARVCELIKEDPHILIQENQCVLRFPSGVYITSRLVTGSFPDYEQIIPKEYCTSVTVIKEDIHRALKKTNVFLNKFRQVSFNLTQAHLTISSHNSELGHTTDTIQATVDGEDITLNFNQQYVVDPLLYIVDDVIRLRFAGIGRALIMTGVSHTNIRYLVMPMNK